MTVFIPAVGDWVVTPSGRSHGALIIRSARYSGLASYVVQVYEWLLSLDDECALIHPSPWTPIKIAYLICRYYPLLVFPFQLWAWLGDHTLETCLHINRTLYLTLIPLQLSAQAVMIFRAYAFTGQRKVILAALCMGYGVILAIVVWFVGIDFQLVTAAFLFVGDTGCFGDDPYVQNDGSNIRTGLVFLSTFFLDACVICLVSWHAVKTSAVQGPLGRKFIHQSILYFIVVSSLNLLTAALYIVPNPSMDGEGLPFALNLSDVIACRLILSLRRHVSPTDSIQLEEQSRVVREALQGA